MSAFAQPCLPEGIIFTTQAQIDSFPINYPYCTEIEGDVHIGYYGLGSDMTNLNGLNVVTVIGGDLIITDTDSLVNLTGLDNLSTIGGDLTLYENNALIDLQGLGNLNSIGGRLMIGCWDNAMWPPGNQSLVSLEGLNNLTNIGGGIKICSNGLLTSIAALSKLTLISGPVEIYFNNSLASLSGLDNIISDSIQRLSVIHNSSLTTCEIASICDYLSDPNGVVTIFDNASGCNSPPEIATSCGFTMPCLPYGNYSFFNNQADIDNFKTNYQDCTILNGDVEISGNDITNLYGLSDVTSIGHLVISENPLLINLSGLNSLTSVTGLGGIYIEDNPTLTSLEGLESLTSNGGQLVIESNDALTNLTGLENLAVIEKFLSIYRNANLSSLVGLDNVDTNSITHLYIENNNVLSTCAVTTICNYLASPHGFIRIEGNAPGCNSVEEVEEACESSCLPEGIFFTTQAQIDSFQTNYPGCIEIEGSVTIVGDDIENLHGLSSLTSIGGTLEIGNDDEGNPNLVNLSGLDSLKTIGNQLYVVSNESLNNLNGLNNLTHLIGMEICNNPSLKNIIALSKLTFLGPSHIINNDSLTNLCGFEGLDTISGELHIRDNDALLSLSGLENLTLMAAMGPWGSSLVISSNDALVNLTGLNKLIHFENGISGWESGIFIYDNDALLSLEGLESIETVQNFSIRDNPSLSVCNTQSFCDYLAIPNGWVIIENNAPGCNSQDEVEDACDTTSVSEFVLQDILTIYPNPCSSAVRLRYLIHDPSTSLGTGSRYLICDLYRIDGRMIQRIMEGKQLSGEHEIEIDVSDLQGGVYFLRVQDNQRIVTKKLIVQ